jgi:tyrosyl-tRNA synthetase
LRLLQKRLAQEITTMVHGQAIFENAKMASTILYSKSFKSDIQTLDEVTFLDIFEGVPTAELPKDLIANGLDMIAALSAETKFLESNGEARRALKENSISVNKEKVGEDYKISEFDLINNTYIIINRGKRSTFIIRVV